MSFETLSCVMVIVLGIAFFVNGILESISNKYSARLLRANFDAVMIELEQIKKSVRELHSRSAERPEPVVVEKDSEMEEIRDAIADFEKMLSIFNSMKD